MKNATSNSKRPHSIVDRFHFGFLWFVRITMAVGVLPAVLSGSWHILGLVIVGLILTFVPFFVEKKYDIDIPIEFEIGIVLLIYGSIFLGEVRNYYSTFWWWDLALHTLTGILVGLIGFLALLVLYRRKLIIASPLSIMILSFSLAAAVGGIWEIFEFSMDQIFGLNMQKSGLLDTMWDLIVNDIGALLASLTGYIYLRTGQVPLLGRMIRRFRKDNPGLARKIPKETKGISR